MAEQNEAVLYVIEKPTNANSNVNYGEVFAEEGRNTTIITKALSQDQG
ncbi:hypothetical protein [Legionella qingyii]|nr:hypothetical protein [Legionella qingyii]